MKKLLILMLVLFCFPVIGQASPSHREVIAEGTYQAGDRDTAEVSEQMALLNAKRNALEQCGTFVTSTTTIKDFIVKDDAVASLAAGVMEVTILDKHRTQIGNGMEFYTKIKAVIYPEKLEAALKLLQNGSMSAPLKPIPRKRVFTYTPDVGNSTMNQLLLNSIQKNDINMVKTAVENGANVNIYKDGNEMATALTLSIGNEEIMNYLISLGADVNATIDLPGNIPPVRINPLMKAVYKNDFISVKTLMENGANVNYSDSRGFRPLDIAISNNYSSIKIIKYLIENGANVNYTIKSGSNPTPLMLAIKNKNIQAIQMLLVAGANLTQVDSKGKTVKDYAADSDNNEIINLFFNR
ncbi:ankyrin repeat domain-containing protein [Pelosinus propionicus]|uniref:Ankyrin repeat-containing protein n=1 Tax=Pelosinus propionicus DSM 13327 TaxID=1123291 RepID=A0A1I4PT20_9FIRM|nr:ankyrin repeat domain-containing protein [Pelosinus propionicus]SFM30904.1 Ankyrin repeat-containing protein [Pelosinus propionicus DSM 13327]